MELRGQAGCPHFLLGRCPSTVLRVALGRALIYEGNETVLGTNPNRTHDQPKPYLETAETVLDLYSDKGMLPFLLHGAHKKNSLKIDAFPVSNRTRNRTLSYFSAIFFPIFRGRAPGGQNPYFSYFFLFQARGPKPIL